MNNDNSDKNIKEEFLQNIDRESKLSESHILKNEYYGMALATLATFFQAFGAFYTKVIQRVYPTKFHTVQFLFLRSFTILILSLFHNYYFQTHILRPKEIKLPFWFFIRTNVNFFGMAFFTMSIWYLRSSTAQIIATLAPIIVFILSYFILREKFYMRYIYGLIICICGSSIIVLNEKKVNNSNNITTHTFKETLTGVFFGIINIFLLALVLVANKILANNKIAIGTQMFYVAISTMTYSSIYSIIFGGVVLDPGLLFMCAIHGIFFYLGNVTNNKALQKAPLSKLIIFNYLQIIFVFLLAYIFLNEKIFFTDIIGTIIILSYMIYNSLNPLPVK